MLVKQVVLRGASARWEDDQPFRKVHGRGSPSRKSPVLANRRRMLSAEPWENSTRAATAARNRDTPTRGHASSGSSRARRDHHGWRPSERYRRRVQRVPRDGASRVDLHRVSISRVESTTATPVQGDWLCMSVIGPDPRRLDPDADPEVPTHRCGHRNWRRIQLCMFCNVHRRNAKASR